MSVRSVRLLAVLVGTIALVSVVGCGTPSRNDDTGTPSSTTTTPAAASLEGPTWTLDNSSLGVDAAGVTITATFAGGTIQGSSGCNNYSGPYTLDGSSLQIGPDIASTMMACEEPAMTAEAAYQTKLPATASYRTEGSELTLLDANGGHLLVYRR